MLRKKKIDKNLNILIEILGFGGQLTNSHTEITNLKQSDFILKDLN